MVQLAGSKLLPVRIVNMLGHHVCTTEQHIVQLHVTLVYQCMRYQTAIFWLPNKCYVRARFTVYPCLCSTGRHIVRVISGHRTGSILSVISTILASYRECSGLFRPSNTRSVDRFPTKTIKILIKHSHSQRNCLLDLFQILKRLDVF